MRQQVVPPGTKKAILRIFYADNQMIVLVDGALVRDVRTVGEPINNEVAIDIAPEKGTVITVVGANLGRTPGDPSRFEAELEFIGVSGVPRVSFKGGTVGHDDNWGVVYTDSVRICSTDPALSPPTGMPRFLEKHQADLANAICPRHSSSTKDREIYMCQAALAMNGTNSPLYDVNFLIQPKRDRFAMFTYHLFRLNPKKDSCDRFKVGFEHVRIGEWDQAVDKFRQANLRFKNLDAVAIGTDDVFAEIMISFEK
jgi:hypothetical protein